MKTYISMMAQQVTKVEEFFASLHENERGDNENLGRLLILALVLIPLIILIAYFGDEILTKANEAWDEIFGTTISK
jgi:hypothetical protein